jgi:hypothetical protein
LLSLPSLSAIHDSGIVVPVFDQPADYPFVPASCLIRCQRLNPSIDLRFAIADLKRLS